MNAVNDRVEQVEVVADDPPVNGSSILTMVSNVAVNARVNVS